MNLLKGKIGKGISIDPDVLTEACVRLQQKRLPPIAIHFLLGQHRHKGDMQKFRHHLSKADIWMPESAGWKEQDLRDFNSIATGELTPSTWDYAHPNASTFFRTRLRALFGTRKSVAIADIQDTDPLHVDTPAVVQDIYAGLEVSRNPNDFVDRLRTNIEIDARYERAREGQILLNLPTAIEESLNDNKPFTQRESSLLRVFFTIGTYHTDLVAACEAAGLPVTHEFDNKREYIRPIDRLMKNVLEGMQIETHDLVQAALEDLLREFVLRVELPSSLRLPQGDRRKARILSGYFNDDEGSKFLFDARVRKRQRHQWSALVPQLQRVVNGAGSQR